MTLVWIRIHERQKCNPFPVGRQALGYLKRHQASERIADEEVRAMGLQLLDCIEMKLCHRFDRCERIVHAVNTSGLHPVDGMGGFYFIHEVEKTKHGVTQTMRDENGRLPGSGLE